MKLTNKFKRVLLLNPPYGSIYDDSKIKAALPNNPSLTLATLAAPLIKVGHEVKIIDLNSPENTLEALLNDIANFNPHFVGLTFTTTLFEQAIQIVDKVKKVNREIVCFGGGVHSSSLPEETLSKSGFDALILGEGDQSIVDFVNGIDPVDIDGIGVKHNGNIYVRKKEGFIKDLDTLEFPAWSLYDIKKFKSSTLINKLSPAANIETSRGCVFGCVYCNKNIFGNRFRKKSVKRVINEIEYMLDLGFKEINILDDCFTLDKKRANAVCDEIIRRRMKFLWNTQNGIRVDCVDRDLFFKFKEAGCYQVTFGIESGNTDILKRIKKGITKDQVVNAVKWAKDAKLEVMGYFMFGLPGETEKTMRDTIEFAKSLPMDYAKVGITIPLPGTPYFDELKEGNYIKGYNWSKFNFYNIPSEIYKHPTLEWTVIEKYYNRFFREFYLRPGFIGRRLIKSIKEGSIIQDVKHFLSTDW